MNKTAGVRLDAGELKEAAPSLKAGERVLLSGWVYTARDAAHKQLFALLDNGEPLPFPLDGAMVYYAGPTKAPPGLPVGSCGPTTSSRMDRFAPRLLDLGLTAMIGKGGRSPEVLEAVCRNQAVYLCALGGAGALACRCIASCETVAFPELGCESIKRLEFREFPLIVGADSSGGNLFMRR